MIFCAFPALTINILATLITPTSFAFAPSISSVVLSILFKMIYTFIIALMCGGIIPTSNSRFTSLDTNILESNLENGPRLMQISTYIQLSLRVNPFFIQFSRNIVKF